MKTYADDSYSAFYHVMREREATYAQMEFEHIRGELSVDHHVSGRVRSNVERLMRRLHLSRMDPNWMMEVQK